ncbi:hypothetical protein BGW41_001723 [Actinomortierella wolfii]|nr:hypothetical protein BGW41_001723 [Actinomortierella wolfii]
MVRQEDCLKVSIELESISRRLEWSTTLFTVLFDDVLDSGLMNVLAINRVQQQQDLPGDIECYIFPEPQYHATGNGMSSVAGLNLAKDSIGQSLSDHDRERLRLEDALVGKHEMMNHCIDTLTGVLNGCFISGSGNIHTDTTTVQQNRINRKRRVEKLKSRLVPLLATSPNAQNDIGSNRKAIGPEEIGEALKSRILVLDRRIGSATFFKEQAIWFQLTVQNISDITLDHITLMVSGLPFRSNTVHGLARDQIATLVGVVPSDPVDDIQSMMEGRCFWIRFVDSRFVSFRLDSPNPDEANDT